MPKANLKSGDDEEDVFPDEARAHVEALEKLMTKIEEEVRKHATSGLLDTILGDLKDVLSSLTPRCN